MEHLKPRTLTDADLTRPALWRGVAFWTLVVVVLTLWVPTVPSEPPREGGAISPFSLGSIAFLVVTVLLACTVVPAHFHIRVIIAAILLGTTLLAWVLEEPIRRFLGSPWYP